MLEWCAREDRPCLLVLARPVSHGSRHRPRDRGRPAGLRLSDPLGAVLPDRRRPDGLGVRPRRPRRAHQARRSTSATCGRRPTARTPTRSCGARRSAARDSVDRVRHSPRELRVRHGPADVHAGAADRRALGHALLLVPGPRLHEAGGLGEDPRGDDHALPRELRADIIAKKKAAMPEHARSSARSTMPSPASV